MAIPAGVVGDDPVSTAVALLDVPAQRGGATQFDGSHGPAPGRRQGGPVGFPVSGTVPTKDLCYLQPGPAHGAGPYLSQGGGRESNGLRVEATVLSDTWVYRAVVRRLP